MFNQFTGIGNLTRDPESGSIPGTGTVTAKFGAAFNSKYKQKGETKTETLFLNVVVFGKMAENCAKFLEKGSLVMVQGRLRQSEWDDKESGEKRKKLELIADHVKFLPKGSKETETHQQAEEEIPAEAPEGVPAEA